MTRYAILGTGAVGGFYGGLLQRSGQDVHFLVRSDYEHIQKFGLRVDSPLGDFKLENVNAYRRPEDLPACDVALIAWKTTENHALPAVLPFALKPGGIALVLQNGLDPELEVAHAFPAAKVLSGLCFLCSRKEGPGWIRHLDYGAITLAAFRETQEVGEGLAEKFEAVTPEMDAVGKDFQAAGIEIWMQGDWRLARWRKLVWNIPFNGLCALLGKDTSQLLQDPDERNRVSALMDEVAAGAKLCGHALPENFRDRMLHDTDQMKPYAPSMKLDRDAHRKMELEAIYARPIATIEAAGGRAPLMRELWDQLRTVEKDRYRVA